MHNPKPNGPDKYPDISPRLFKTALCMMGAVAFLGWLVIKVIF